MKVLELITRLDRGGAPRIFLQLVKGLKEHGLDIVMASGPSRRPEEDPGEFSQRLQIPYYPLSHLRRDISPIRDFLALLELVAIIRRERPLLLHTHTTKAGFVGRLTGAITHTRTIHTPHGHLFYGYFGRAKERLYVLLERMAVRFSEKIITISEDERREYLKRGIGNEKKVVTIYNGIDLERFPGNGGKVRGELGITGVVPLVGFVGRLEEVKGPQLFMEAAAMIKIERPQTHFLIVGDGPMKGELMKMAQAISHLRFLGHREDISDVIAALDLLLIPSLNDGFNLAAVEAMASYKPIVATAVGGLPEVVGDGGILVRPDDRDGMAQGTLRLLNSSQLRMEMGERGRKRAEVLFDWNGCLQRTLDLYRRVVWNLR